MQWFLQAGKLLYGNHFKIYQEDLAVYRKLLGYFLFDPEYCQKHEINPNKGLLITGPVGCGKTSILTLMNHFLDREQRFPIKNCRDLSMQFAKQGFDVITRITATKSHHQAYDDLGAEHMVKHYGNDCNVMTEVILSSYDVFIQNSQSKTHFTTNLSATELEKRYGVRARSRLRAMVNLVSFSGESKDKRG